MKRFWLLYVVLFVAFSAQSQALELGKVTIDQLKQTEHPLEPDAPAAIIFHTGKTYMDPTKGFILITEVEMCIKIYKKEGYEWANKAIQYYVGENPPEVIKVSKAVTYNLVNGEIVKTKLAKDGEFDEKYNKYWMRKKIAMPNVKEGSIIEFRYEINSPYIVDIPEWRFQTSIPVNYSEFITKFPNFCMFNTNLKGFFTPERTQVTENRFYELPRVRSYQTGQPQTTEHMASQGSYTELITTYVAQNVPSMKDDKYVNNIDNYISSIEHELAMVKWPNMPVKNFSTSWEDLAKTIYNYESFGVELSKKGYFETEINKLTSGLLGNEQKMNAIFQFVRDRMNWNGDYGYTCDEGVKKAFTTKTGSVGDVNLLLISMLRSVGIDANPVLVSTRSNGIALFPNRRAYNYVICAVEDRSIVTLLDATDKNAQPNILPVRALNWYGRLIRENGSSSQIDLMPKRSSKDVVNLVASIDTDGKITGKIRNQYFDYNALLYRQLFGNVKKNDYLELLEKKLKGIEIADDYAVTSDDFEKPVTETYSFSHDNASELISDKIYFSPLLFFAKNENPFKQDKREYPVDFIFPNQDKYMFTVNLPEGYVIESLPAPSALNLSDGICKFAFNITSSGKQVQIASAIEINEAMVGAEDYPALKEFFKAVIEKQNEKIVLKKI